MEAVIFSDRQGSGYICSNSQQIKTIAQPLPVTVNGKTYSPGDKTTLENFFCRELEYIGRLDSEAIFLMGSKEDLINSVYYYQSVYVISDARIYLTYGPKFGRDYNFIKGEWK